MLRLFFIGQLCCAHMLFYGRDCVLDRHKALCCSDNEEIVRNWVWFMPREACVFSSGYTMHVGVLSVNEPKREEIWPKVSMAMTHLWDTRKLMQDFLVIQIVLAKDQ